MARHLSQEDLDLLSVLIGERILGQVAEERREIRELKEAFMAAIDDVNTALGNLSNAVDAAVAKLGTVGTLPDGAIAPEDAAGIAPAVQAQADRLSNA